MINYNDPDPAMRYESLYRFAFDCSRFNDPWEAASQSNYGIFMQNDFSEAKASLYRILHKLIFDNFKNNKSVSKKLIEIEEKVATIASQEEAIAIIDDATNSVQVISI